MRLFRSAGIFGALALLFAPVALRAQSCSQLSDQRWRMNQEASDLAQYEWGSALVLGGCIVAGMENYRQNRSESDAAGVITICAGTGCALTTNYQNCLGVVVRLFIYAVRVQNVESLMRSRGCRL